MAIPPERFYAKLNKKDAVAPHSPPRASLQPVPASTPVRLRQTGTHPHSTCVPKRDELNFQLAQETKGDYIGPMSPGKFLVKFLPVKQGTLPCPLVTAGFCRPRKRGKESNMYTPLINGASSFAPGFTFSNTHSHPDTNCDRLAPDVCLYPTNSLPPLDRPTDFSLIGVPIEDKPDEEQDPFIDPEEEHALSHLPDYRFEKDTDDAKKIRGQVASYVSALLGSQFRLHTFVVLRFGEYARLMRWDRCGAIVTRRFKYTEAGDRNFLAQFFWRYSHASPCHQGHDPSVRIATPKEISEIDKKSTSGTVYLEKENPRHREYRLMAIPDREDPTKEYDFLISYPPQYTSRSPLGRATRAMPACDPDGNYVFLKDYWRTDSPDMEKEGDIYKILEDHKVRHIAPFGRGNDVRGYETVTDKLRDEKWACKETNPMKPLRLYRMSLDMIGRSLTAFNSSAEYVKAIADVMEGHDDAYFNARILHRDISVGNMLIADDGEGIIIDWDLSINLAKANNSSRRSERTGTWQFMSAAMNMDRTHHQIAVDDRESALYVLVWVALCYTKHNQLGDLRKVLSPYEECYESSTGPTGGLGKQHFLSHPRMITFDKRPHLDALVKSLADHFTVRYAEDVPPPDHIDPILALLADPQADIPSPYDEDAVAVFLSVSGTPVNAVMKQFPHYPRAWRLTNLDKRGWLVDTIREYVSEPGWPPRDKAKLNDFPTSSKGVKRKNHFENWPTQIKSTKLHHGGSRLASAPNN